MFNTLAFTFSVAKSSYKDSAFRCRHYSSRAHTYRLSKLLKSGAVSAKDANYTHQLSDCQPARGKFLAAVVGVDGDIVVRQIAGPDIGLGRTTIQVDAHYDFISAHHPLTVFFAVGWIALTILGDEHIS